MLDFVFTTGGRLYFYRSLSTACGRIYITVRSADLYVLVFMHVFKIIVAIVACAGLDQTLIYVKGHVLKLNLATLPTEL